MEPFKDGPYHTVRQEGYNTIGITDVASLLKWGKKPKGAGEANHRMLISAVKDIQSSWYGMTASEIFAMTGWAEGLDIAKQYMREMPRVTTESIKRKVRWSEDGEEFDRDRFDAGNDECWSSRKHGKGRGTPILNLTCAIGGRGSRSASELVWMGAAAFAVADAAEEAGYRVEISGVSHATDSNARGDSIQIIKIKEAGEPLDRESTVMALSCPAFFRWYVIHSRAAFHESVRCNDGYGRTTEIPSQYQGQLHMPHCYNSYSAAQAVDELIAKIGLMGEVAV